MTWTLVWNEPNSQLKRFQNCSIVTLKSNGFHLPKRTSTNKSIILGWKKLFGISRSCAYIKWAYFASKKREVLLQKWLHGVAKSRKKYSTLFLSFGAWSMPFDVRVLNLAHFWSKKEIFRTKMVAFVSAYKKLELKLNNKELKYIYFKLTLRFWSVPKDWPTKSLEGRMNTKYFFFFLEIQCHSSPEARYSKMQGTFDCGLPWLKFLFARVRKFAAFNCTTKWKFSKAILSNRFGKCTLFGKVRICWNGLKKFTWLAVLAARIAASFLNTKNYTRNWL